MITFNIITLFPELIEPHLSYLPFKKAIELNEIKVNLVNLRNFAIDERGTVDDKTYGGGVGMVLRIEPIYNALQTLENKGKVILMSPSGQRYTQQKARELKEDSVITFISGRYEGVDNRVKENLVDETISIGDYVLSGGELPCLVIMESITRLLQGILEKDEASQIESFENGSIEYPQYTRPENFMGMKVPEILLSGHHKEIEKWREINSKPNN